MFRVIAYLSRKNTAKPSSPNILDPSLPSSAVPSHPHSLSTSNHPTFLPWGVGRKHPPITASSPTGLRLHFFGPLTGSRTLSRGKCKVWSVIFHLNMPRTKAKAARKEDTEASAWMRKVPFRTWAAFRSISLLRGEWRKARDSSQSVYLRWTHRKKESLRDLEG